VADIIGARRACTVGDDFFGVDALQVDAGRAKHWRGRAGAGSRSAARPRARAQRRGAADAARSDAGRPLGRRTGGTPRARSRSTRAARVGPSMPQNSGPIGRSTRAASHGCSCSQPQASMPISRRRPPLPLCTSSEPRRRSRSRSPAAGPRDIAALIPRRPAGVVPRQRRGERRRPAESRAARTVMGTPPNRRADGAPCPTSARASRQRHQPQRSHARSCPGDAESARFVKHMPDARPLRASGER
jgi:hypothetical protein